VLSATACSSEDIPLTDSGVATANDAGEIATDTGVVGDAGSMDAAVARPDATPVADAGVILDATDPVADVGHLPAECESQVRFSLSGVITQVSTPDDQQEILAARLNGQRIEAIIGFDPSVRDSRALGDYGQYRQPPANSEMTLLIAAVAHTLARPSSFFVEPFNNFQERGDRLNFVGNFDEVNGANHVQAVVVFRDASGQAIAGVESPNAVPSLDVWNDGCTIQITSSGRETPEVQRERRQACEGMTNGDRCRIGEVEGRCNRTREGLLCRGADELPLDFTIMSRVERIVDLCAQ
jgi:hypothetical protein